MYHAKEAGGCRYAFFQQNMRETGLIKQAPVYRFALRHELRDRIREMPLANKTAGQSESLFRPAWSLSDLTALKVMGEGQEHAVSKYRLNSGVEVIRSLPHA